MRRILGVVLLAAGMAIPTGWGLAEASGKGGLVLPDRPAFFPESITAAPDGSLFVSSLVTGEIVRFAPGSTEPTTFVAPGVNVGTAGVMIDSKRDVLWACDVSLGFPPASNLRAFDLETGALVASYPVPDHGLCADIVLARGDVYATDTLLGRILRLTGTTPTSPIGEGLEVWSADPRLAAAPPPAFLQINGIAFNGDRTFYTTNYSTGELFAVRIGRDGTAEPAVPIALDQPLTNPDGIRWRGAYLYVADNVMGLVRIDPRTGTTTVLDDSLDQPTSLAFVGRDVWITEGQVLRLVANEPPNLPFRIVRVRLDT